MDHGRIVERGNTMNFWKAMVYIAACGICKIRYCMIEHAYKNESRVFQKFLPHPNERAIMLIIPL